MSIQRLRSCYSMPLNHFSDGLCCVVVFVVLLCGDLPVGYSTNSDSRVHLPVICDRASICNRHRSLCNRHRPITITMHQVLSAVVQYPSDTHCIHRQVQNCALCAELGELSGQVAAELRWLVESYHRCLSFPFL